MFVKSNGIVLGSFAGSGTTAHAVLSANAKDSGHRRLILIELGEYADSLTSTRVKRVIEGTGEMKKAVSGTGGSFSFFELGVSLFVEGSLNAEVDAGQVLDYVWFTETGAAAGREERPVHPDFLGRHAGVSYFFAYDPGAVTTLDRAYLSAIPVDCGADSYVMYADLCTLSDSELAALNITFKKIPRDIARL